MNLFLYLKKMNANSFRYLENKSREKQHVFAQLLFFEAWRKDPGKPKEGVQQLERMALGRNFIGVLAEMKQAKAADKISICTYRII